MIENSFAKEHAVTKFEQMREIFHGAPDAVFVLSGGIIPQEGAERNREPYKTTAYSDLDNKGFLGGGKARVIAAAEASELFPDATIVATSLIPKEREMGLPTHAEVIAEELALRGVAKKRIFKEEKSLNTITELIEMVKLAVMKNWQHVGVISNDYHLSRLKEMFARLADLADSADAEFASAYPMFQERKITTTFVAAEDILPLRSTHYVKLIEDAKKSEAYQNRVEAEAQGLKDLQEGKYGKKKKTSES